MTFKQLFVLVGAVLLLGPIGLARPHLGNEEGEITAEEVSEAIDDAKQFLKSQQRPDGTWPNQPGYASGLTPLCTLALLNAGCGLDDPVVKKALDQVRSLKVDATYTTSLQTMALCAADPKRDRLLIQRNVKWLEGRQHKTGPTAGMWAIPDPGTPDHTDNSMTHLAMLALYDAERSGVRVNEKTWRLALDYWRRSQNPDGSWGWGPGHPGTGSMTCAGIAAITIAEGRFNFGEAKVEGEIVRCCQEQRANEHVERAFTWLERHFTVKQNPGMKFWHYYYLYSLERSGRMTGRRFIGQHDWFREASRVLVNRQLVSGAWPSDMDSDEYQADPHVSTSFALMFLAKARRPIVLARLKHEPAVDWNHHPNGLFNLVTAVERSWQRDLGSQVVDVSRATVEDLLESPVLYLSGRQAPQFSAEEKQKLRMYVDRGGFLFAEQCCDGGDFDAGFRALMKELFPESESTLRLLPPEHPLWYAETRVDPRHLRELWGIDVGCRTSVAYCPQSLSCYWELDRAGRESDYPPAVQEQVRAAREMGVNVLAYATNRELTYKDPAVVAASESREPAPGDRGALRVANLYHPGGCDAAPSALKNLLRLAGDQLKVRAVAETGDVRLTDRALFQYPVVLLHGRRAFELTPEERKQLRTYLDRGGMVFADAICSNKEFAESFAREMKAIFPEQALERIPSSDSLFSSEWGGDEITTVSRRQPQKAPAGAPLKASMQATEPYLEGLRLGDRYAVIFSPYDISCALAGHETLDCEGYARRDAARLALNVLLYALQL